MGYGQLGGATRAFLLTPSAIPEPGSIALLTLGTLGLAASRLRSRRQTRLS